MKCPRTEQKMKKIYQEKEGNLSLSISKVTSAMGLNFEASIKMRYFQKYPFKL